jgi:Tfp pilus assembly protein PilF
MQYIEGTTLAEVIKLKRQFGSGRSPVAELEGDPTSSRKRAAAPGRPTAPGGSSTNRTAGGALELSPSGRSESATTSFRGRSAFRALARLAIQAAEALHHAHAMGILHRDIKPSNLLVDTTGNLWVTDFGLARFQGEPGLTHTGDLLGTLRYMPPELVLGEGTFHDPRSDIYSLGATLYELLTLRPVFDGRDRQALLRQIAQEEPLLPRRVDPMIPRDLETIVLKAMDKEPIRRYATAQELALDLHRFLEDKTIHARRPNAAERAAKWSRRHRAVLLAAATVAFLALAVATPLLWWEQRKTDRMYQDLRLTFEQADRGFQQMIRLSDALTINGMARYSEPNASPAANATRETFFRQAIEFYERLSREPQITKAMKALAYQRLGLARMVRAQGPAALDDLRRASALYEELLAGSPRDPQLRYAMSDVEMNQGIVLVASRGMQAAQPSLSRATAIDEGLASDFPDDPALLAQLTDRRLQIAGWHETSGQRTHAEQERRRLFAFYEKLASAASAAPGRAHSLAASYERLAGALGAQGWPREQQEALRRGLALKPDDPALENDLAWSLALPPDSPPRDVSEAVDLAKKAVAAKPKERAVWNTLGLAHLRAGHWALAAEAISKSIELQSQGGDASDHLVLAMVSWRRGDKAAALDWYIRALDWLSRNPESDASVLALRTEAERLLGRSGAAAIGPKR